MTDHLGSCLCGTVSFEVKGDFDSFYLCHCLASPKEKLRPSHPGINRTETS